LALLYVDLDDRGFIRDLYGEAAVAAH
jgi:hypothetical protein